MSKPHEVTDANFNEEVLQSDIPVLVDFWAGWCAPCKMIAPTVEKIAVDFEGKIKVCKMDVDSNPQTPGNFGIRSIPTLILFKDGQPADQLVGAQPEPAIVSRIEQILV